MKTQKILVFLLLGLFLISFASAMQIDNKKIDAGWKNGDYKSAKLDLKENDLWTKYKPMKVENLQGFGKTLFEGALTEHTERCAGDYCYSIMEIYTSGDDAIIDETIFKTLQDDGSWIEQDVRNYKWSYYTGGEQVLVDDYEFQCSETGKISVNGTKEMTCSNVKVGNHYEETPEYSPLSEGEVKPEGNYKVKLEAWKKPSRTVDWVIETNGELIDEWAEWGFSALNNEVHLNYNFDETSGSVLDQTDNSNDGTYTGSDRENGGIIGSSYGYDGTVKTTFPDMDFSSGEATVSMWVNPSFTCGSEKWAFAYRDAEMTFGNLRFCDGGDVVGSLGNIGVSMSSGFNFTGWQHIVISGSTSGTVSLYINGNLEDSDTSSASGSGAFYGEIGGDGSATARDFEGDIDEVTIWNRTLTSDDVLEIYNSGIGITYPFPTGQVTLNSPTDTQIVDSANTLFNGTATVTGGATLVNMSLWNNDGGWSLKNTTNLGIVSANGLVGYYRLDESSGAVIDGANNNDGTNVGATTGVTGKINTAYDFENDNSDQINLNNGAEVGEDLDFTGDFSICAWVKPEDTAGTKIIVGKRTGGNYQYVFRTNAGKLELLTTGGAVISTNNSITTGSWQYVCVARQHVGNTFFFYNGEKEFTVTTKSIAHKNTDTYIGHQEDVDGNNFDGIIDEVSLWDKVLSDLEISNLYNSGNGNVPSVGTTSTQTFNYSIPSGDTIWNIQACDSDGDCGFAPSNFTVSLDATAPSIEILYPTGLINTLVEGQSLALNYSITDTNLEDCWYSYNGTNTTIADCALNTSFNYAFGEDNLTLWANDTVGNIQGTLSSWSAKIIENSQTFSETTVEGSIESFIVNLTLDESIEISSATLEYDGESESASIVSSGNGRIISVSAFEIPSYVTETNVSFYWSLTLDDSTQINLTSRNQTVTTINLDNCDSYSFELFNLSLFDEETLSPLNGTIQLYYEVLNVPNYNTIQNYSGEFEDISNTLVCSEANLSGQNLVYSVEIRYYSTDYATELYHIQKSEIGEVQPISLYDLALNDTTEFKIEYQNSNLQKVENAVIQLQRKYIPENVYRVVEAPLTSNEGTAIVHIDLDTNKYRATVVKDGEVLDTFENIIFVCENELSGQCEQALYGDIDPQNIITIEELNDFTYTVSNENGTVSTAFTIPSGTPSPINILLSQTDMFGNETLCNKTVISSAGLVECTYNETIGDSYLKLEVTKDGELQALKGYVVEEDSTLAFLDNNFILVFIFMLSIVGMAFTSPELIVVNSVVTMLIAGSLWLLNGVSFVMGMGSLMWLIVAAAILIMKIAKQEDK